MRAFLWARATADFCHPDLSLSLNAVLSGEQPIHGTVQIVLRGVNGSMDTASSTAGKNTFSADSLKGMHCEAYRTDKMNVYCQNVR